MAPVVAAAEARHEGDVEVVTFDVTDDPQLARELGIRAVPTYIARTTRGEVARRVGRISAGELDALFAAARDEAPAPGRISRSDRLLPLGAAAALVAAGVAASVPALVVVGVLAGAFGAWDLVVPRGTGVRRGTVT
jgi:hypothetical protein